MRCPKCLSLDVERDVLMFGGPAYICKKCGYRGPLVLEQEVGGPVLSEGGGGQSA